MIQGKIIRVAGPVVDVQFTAGRLPALQEALTVTAEGTERTMEVAQHVNESTVRCIMLSACCGSATCGVPPLGICGLRSAVLPPFPLP